MPINRDTTPRIVEWAEHAYKVGIVVIPLLGVMWILLKSPIKNALGVTTLESSVSAVQDSLRTSRSEMLAQLLASKQSSQFLAVAMLCNSGKYNPDEIKAIKTRYRRGVLDVDSLIADWYER